MSLSTYTELKTSLANWLHRSDLANVIPDFITVCEADFNRRLRIAQMEVRSTASFDEAYEDLPEDFLELREVKVTSDPIRSLKYLTPQVMTESYPTLSSGIPEFYTIVDTQIRVNRLPTSTVEIAYYIRIPALTDVATTNWVLLNHPDLYLYGSLAASEPFLKNDARMLMWKGLYEAALKQIDEADKRARWSGSSLSMTSG
jgi:hypothetical protein